MTIPLAPLLPSPRQHRSKPGRSRRAAAALGARLAGCALGLTVLPATVAGQVPFTGRIVDPAFHGDCKALGDFDGDGLLDVAVGGRELRWYRYPSWSATAIATPAAEFTTDMQAGDVDGDGDLDLVVPDNDASGFVLWFENPRPGGDPTLAAWPRHVIGTFGWTHDVEVGDIDGNGRIDVVTRTGATALWLQTAADTWLRVDLPAASPGGEGVAIGDIDRDGDLDLALNGYWLECPSDPRVGSAWLKHGIVVGWPDLCGVRVADVDGDSRPDVVLAASESTGRLAWFQGPLDPRSATAWSERSIDLSVDFVHTFQVVDVDRDGNLDVAFAEMAQSLSRRVGVFYSRLGGAAWDLQVLSSNGSHNLRTGDIGGDGDIDIVGSNWQGPPVELWENELPPCPPPLDAWTYIEVDSTRGMWGDWDTPDWAKYFGLGLGDLTSDGRADIVSGRYFYRNPGGDLSAAWPRVDLGLNCDAHSIVDVDGDAFGDVIASAGDRVLWLEAGDALGSTWVATAIDTSFPKPGHGNPQGYLVADILPGGRPEILLSDDSGGSVWSYSIPSNPSAGAWPRTGIVQEAGGEGIAVADIDRDGQPDVATAHHPPGWLAGDPRWVKWAKNPGNGSGNWTTHLIGTIDGNYADRVAAGDLNGDGRADVVVTEEEQPVSPDWKTYWFEAPLDPATGTWTRHVLVQQYTTNSLDLADMDGDGDLDIVLGEHRGDRKLAIWENDGVGNFTEHVVDTGRESHLGARVADLDGDGDLEIVSIAWDAHEFLHLWRNDRGCAVDPSNRAPSVSAGADQTLVLPARVARLAGSVVDDGLPAGGQLTLEWTRVSGPGAVVFASPSAAQSLVRFERSGNYTLRLSADDGDRSASDELEVRVMPYASDLVLHWTLDDGVGAVATDSAPWSNHGTLAGPGWAGGIVGGGALDFDGVTAHAYRGSAALDGPFPGTPAQTDAFTVSAWVRLDRTGQRNPIAGKQGNNERGFLLMTEADDRLTLEVFKSAASGDSVSTASALTTGRNYHVAASYEFRGDGASAVRLYIDGVPDATVDTAVGPLRVNPTAFEIGRYWWDSGYSAYLDGIIDDVRVHSRALSGCEVARLASGNFDTDSDGLPDAWEQAWLGGLGTGPEDDSDGDGVSNHEEHISGTDPASATSRDRLLLSRASSGGVVAWFGTVVATGPGLECESRPYDLVLANEVATGPWTPTPPCVDLAATGGTVSCTVGSPGLLDFIRVAPRLER